MEEVGREPLGGLCGACAGLLLAASAAAVAPPAEIAPWLRVPRGSEVELAPRGEPGGRFVMEGRVLGAGDSAPLAGITLYVYHVDRNGLYALKSAAYPRLAGVLRTDSLGRYRVLSILPGQYAGAPHIHFEAWGPDLPAVSWFVNLYMGPNEKPGREWGRMAGVHRLALDPNRPETYVTRDARGVFHARYDLRWSRGFRMPDRADASRRGRLLPARPGPLSPAELLQLVRVGMQRLDSSGIAPPPR